MVGSRLHVVLPPFAGLRTLDRVVGAFVGVVGRLCRPVAAGPFALRRARQRLAADNGLGDHSVVVQRDPLLRPQPLRTLCRRLRRLVSEDGFPQVFDQIIPGQDVGPPPGSVPLAPALVTSVSASTVKVEGEACGRIQEGSGWTVAPGLVVTNAHVVAGEPAGSTSVLVARRDGQTGHGGPVQP